MSSKRHDFLLGVVVLAFIALLFATVVFIYPSLGVSTRTIVVHFKHDEGVAPLKEGSPVLLSGALQVGKITGVSRVIAGNDDPPDERGQLLIAVQAEVDSDLVLYDDCQITTDQPPVGGGGLLVITSVGSPNRAPIEEGDVIKGLPPQSFAAAIGNLSRRLLGPGGFVEKLDQMIDADREGSLTFKIAAMLDDVKAMTGQLRDQLDPDQQKTLLSKVHLVMDHLADAMASIRSEVEASNGASLVSKVHVVLDSLDHGLGEATGILQENRPAIRGAMKNIEALSQTANEDLMKSLRAELDRDNPDSLLGKVHVTVDTLNVSLENISAMTATGRTVLVANKPAIDRTIANVKAMSEQLKLASDEIRIAPYRLIWAPSQNTQEKMGVFEAARTFAEAATYLDDAAARLEAVSAGGGSTGADEEIDAILTSLRAAFERFHTAEDFLWEKMK